MAEVANEQGTRIACGQGEQEGHPLPAGNAGTLLVCIDKSSFFPYLYLCTDRSLLPRALAIFVKARFVAVRSCNGEGGFLMPSVLLIDPIPAPLF